MLFSLIHREREKLSSHILIQRIYHIRSHECKKITPRRAVRPRNSSPTRKTYRLSSFDMRKGSEKKRSATVSDEKERSKSKTHAPIIQNAVKTPTPPHCAKDFTVATVGTISTFDAAQCWRGMKDLSTSLMLCLYRFILGKVSPKHFPPKFEFRVFSLLYQTLNKRNCANIRFKEARQAPFADTHARAHCTAVRKRIRSRSSVKRITQNERIRAAAAAPQTAPADDKPNDKRIFDRFVFICGRRRRCRE